MDNSSKFAFRIRNPNINSPLKLSNVTPSLIMWASFYSLPWLGLCSLAFQATTPNILSFTEDLADVSLVIFSVLSIIYLKASWNLHPPVLLSFWNSSPLFLVSCMYMFASFLFSGTSDASCPTKLIISSLRSLSCNLHFHLKLSLSKLENNTRKQRTFSSLFPPSNSEVI